jgi:hypothetical protein
VQGAALARHSHAQGCYPTALRPIQQWQKATAKPPPCLTSTRQGPQRGWVGREKMLSKLAQLLNANTELTATECKKAYACLK